MAGDNWEDGGRDKVLVTRPRGRSAAAHAAVLPATTSRRCALLLVWGTAGGRPPCRAVPPGAHSFRERAAGHTGGKVISNGTGSYRCLSHQSSRDTSSSIQMHLSCIVCMLFYCNSLDPTHVPISVTLPSHAYPFSSLSLRLLLPVTPPEQVYSI
jgi:hypothetical protein